MYLENLRHVIHSRPIGCNKSSSSKYFVTYRIKSPIRGRYTRNKKENEIETKRHRARLTFIKRRTVWNNNEKEKAINKRKNNFCKKYIKNDEQESPKEHFKTKIHFCENF